MNGQFPAAKYQLTEAIYDANTMHDELNFYNQGQGSPDELTKQLTYILGDYTKNYPLSTMTLGGAGYGNDSSVKELNDVQFTYPIMGRDEKVCEIYDTIYTAGDEPGKGHAPFYAIFGDNWIKRFYTIESERGIQAYVLEDPESMPTGGFRYKLQLSPAGPLDFCDLGQLEIGIKWAMLFVNVAESESRTTETGMMMPGSFKNQMGFMRTGLSWAGNAANKMMKINVKTDNGETNVWMDWFMYQFEKKWLNDQEHFLWYSRYNRLADGTIPLKDMLTSKVIPQGSGVLEQIANKGTYAKMTYNTLANKVGNALFGNDDNANMNITLMTGTGGMREFDRAMKDMGVVGQSFGSGDVASKFVSGSGYNLALGGFFNTFYHIDGYTIKVKKAQIFDTGRVAQKSALHPESGLPLESYRMVFLDDNDNDGSPNVVQVCQKGRSFIQGIQPGMAPMPKSVKILQGMNSSAESNIVTTDQDKSSYYRMKSAGIQIMRANRCFDLQCTAGVV